MTNRIHPSAMIAEGVQLGQNNRIGPFAVIEADVVLGDDNTVLAHAVLRSGTRLGNGNTVCEHAVLGGLPQDLGFPHDLEFGARPTYVEIGDRNVLREGVSINRATREQGSTRLGDDNYLMTQVHLGHDCQLGNRVIIAPSTGLGGHVRVADRAFISGGVMVHQFARIGRFAMIGGNTKLTQDALPFFITDGVPGRVRGLNLVGLRRAGFSASDLGGLKRAFRTLFRSGLTLEEIQTSLAASDDEYVRELADFIAASKRGFHRDKAD